MEGRTASKAHRATGRGWQELSIARGLAADLVGVGARSADYMTDIVRELLSVDVSLFAHIADVRACQRDGRLDSRFATQRAGGPAGAGHELAPPLRRATPTRTVPVEEGQPEQLRRCRQQMHRRSSTRRSWRGRAVRPSAVSGPVLAAVLAWSGPPVAGAGERPFRKGILNRAPAKNTGQI